MHKVESPTEARFWDREAERSVLADCLSDSEAAETAIEMGLKPEHFSAGHNDIFRAIVELVGRDVRVSIPAVQQSLLAAGTLEGVGGLTGLMDLSRGGIRSVQHGAPLVLERAMVRAEYQRAWRYCQDLTAPGADVAGVMDHYRADLDGDARLVRQDEPWDIRSAVEEVFPELEQWAENPTLIRGFRIGISQFDTLTSGLRAKQLSVVGGGTSAGKSQFIQHVVRMVALGGASSLLLSTEMGKEETIFRWVFQEAGFDKELAQRGGMTADMRRRFRDGAWKLGERGNIFGWEVGNFDLSRIAVAVRRYRRRHDVRFVAVDLLNGLNLDQQRGENMAQTIMRVCAGLKAIAQQEDVHVMASAHVSKEAMRDLRVLSLNDFRDSAGVEQWADLAMMLMPYDFKNRLVMKREEAAAFQDREGFVPILCNVCKHRNGSLGAIPMRLIWSAGGKFGEWE